MKILLINKFYFEKGGAERYFFALKKLLEDNGHQVVVLAMHHPQNFKSKYTKYFVSYIEPKPSFNIFKNIKIVLRFWWSLEARKKIKKIIKQEKPDIAHLHNIYHQISPSILSILKNKKIPVVMTVHDYSLICPNYNLYLNGGEYTRALGQKYYQCLIDKCVNKSFAQSFVSVIEMYLHHKILKIYKKNIDLFITPSQFVKEKLTNAGFTNKKIQVISHFVDIKKVVTKKNIPISKKNLLFIGRLSSEKGIQILIKAISDLKNINLKIIGDGPLKDTLKNFVKKNNIDNIVFLGQLSQTQVFKHINNANAVIVPSLSPETFGFVALESLMFGTPVIASQIGALPEIIDQQFLYKAGDTKQLRNKILWLTNKDKNIIIKDDEVAKIREKYASSKHYQAIINVYNQLLKKN